MSVDYPIDAVITWVDGNDVNWQDKINPYLEKKIDWSNKKETIRFQSIDEISYCVKSIIKFAPFIRNIFIVTDNQVPEGLDRLMKLSSKIGVNLEVIDHTVIFRDYENYLPCFNSISIISMLFRIPGLAEHFIIFNDDTFLMKAVSKNDFFKGEYPIVRGVWDHYYEDQKLRNLYVKFLSFFGTKKGVGKPGYKKVQQKSAKLLGLKKYIKRGHTPVSIRKSTIETFFKEHPQIFENNIKHRLRNENQFMISSLSNHLEAKQNTYHLDNNLKLTYFQSYKYLYIIKIKLKKFTLDKDKLFMCFQNLEIAKNNQLDYILNWIEAKLK